MRPVAMHMGCAWRGQRAIVSSCAPRTAAADGQRWAVRALALAVWCLPRPRKFDGIGRAGCQLVGGAVRRAQERDAPVRRVERGRAEVAAGEVEGAQLAPSVGELEREAGAVVQVAADP